MAGLRWLLGVVVCVGLVVVGGGVALAAAPEEPVVKPVGSITGTTAVFEGTLNPHALGAGEAGSYEFVYRQSASECRGEGERSAGGSFAAGLPEEPAGPVEVAELLPNAAYTVCLLARNEAGEEALSAPVSFSTLAVKPVISASQTRNETPTSAELTARIEPNGSDTTYRFEYGTSSAYGASFPVPDGDVGAGRGIVAVSHTLTGLAEGATYHWRVLAINAAGTVTGPDHSFVYLVPSGELPDNRAYEMVTPVQKNAASFALTPRPEVSQDGRRMIALEGTQCFGDATSCSVVYNGASGGAVMFSRTGSGWTSNSLAPSATQGMSRFWLGNADEGTALFTMPTPPGMEEDFYARRPDGSFVDIGPMTPPTDGILPGDFLGFYRVGTADLTHFAFSLSYGSHVWPFEESNGQTIDQYSGTGNTHPAMVGVSGGPGSTDLISGNTGLEAVPGAVSADGEKVYFVAIASESGSGVNAGIPVPADEIYARIGERQTVRISGRSPSECTTAACQSSAPATARFVAASADGSKAFFSSAQQLLDSASGEGENLYEYDFDKPSGHNLIDVSFGDTSGHGPRVQGVEAVSPDGSHVYFVAQGVLTTAANGLGQSASEGADNLYVFERDQSHPQGEIRFVTQLAEADSLQWRTGDETGWANVTPDGRFLVFESHGSLTPDTTRTDGAMQIYRYDAQTQALVRLSVGERGFNDNGNGGAGDAEIVASSNNVHFHAGPARSDPTMSHDGSFVFFESPIGLTPGALNDVRLANGGYAENVYEWHEGQVYLISDGKDMTGFQGRSAVELLGSDATGANVFFSTADALVLQDTDTEGDFYDARICTAGEPCVHGAASSAACVGESCRGAAAVSPSLPVAVTLAGGAGNLAAPIVKRTSPRGKPPVKCKRGRRRVHGKCVKAGARHGKTRRTSSRKGGK